MILSDVEQLQKVAAEVSDGQRCAHCLRWVGERKGPPIWGCYTCTKEDAEWLGTPMPGRA